MNEEPAIRTNGDLRAAILLKLGLFEHEPWLMAFVAHLLGQTSSEFPIIRLSMWHNGIVMAQYPNRNWTALGSFTELAQTIRELSTKIVLDPDERGVLLGRLVRIKRKR